MKHHKCNPIPFILMPAMLFLIFDSKTALAGALSGIEVCLHTVIPSLLPLMVLSALFTNSMLGKKPAILSPVGRLCGMPKGSETILLTGLLGGYPLGAITLANACKSGHITKHDSNRMLAFCSNCGPAFIFGLGGFLFANKWIPLMLWLIHIISAIFTGAMIPGKSTNTVKLSPSRPASPTKTIADAVRSMAMICSWIILFKTASAFCQKWFLWLFPVSVQAIICGILELTNGFIMLLTIPDEGMRFLLASALLAWGGLCICLQTASQIGNLSLKSYVFGKTLQTLISIVLSVTLLMIQTGFTYRYCLTAVLSIVILSILLYFCKKHIDFSNSNIYNGPIKALVR